MNSRVSQSKTLHWGWVQNKASWITLPCRHGLLYCMTACFAGPSQPRGGCGKPAQSDRQRAPRTRRLRQSEGAPHQGPRDRPTTVSLRLFAPLRTWWRAGQAFRLYHCQTCWFVIKQLHLDISQRRLICFSNLEDAESRSLDNLGRVYARMGQFEDAIKVWVLAKRNYCGSLKFANKKSKRVS